MKLNTSKSSRDGRLAGSGDRRGDQGENGRRDVHLTTVGARDERIYPSLGSTCDHTRDLGQFLGAGYAQACGQNQ